MHSQQYIDTFVQLSNFFQSFLIKIENHNHSDNIEDKLEARELDLLRKINESYLRNNWFTKENVYKSLKSWQLALQKENLEKWLSAYELEKSQNPKTVGIIMAGNIPFVGFHDLISVLVTGNIAKIKLSSSDNLLIPYVLEILVSFAPEIQNQIQFAPNKLENFDAVIATGSNNTARYFEHYFGKYPNIIRKNRNSIAVLHGNESNEEIKALGHDIFDYFGLGCRSVSKIFLPKGFDIDHFYKNIFDFQEVVNHNKYANNYDYNKAIYLLDGVPILDNGFLLIKEDNEAFASPVGVLFYEYYDDLEELKTKLEANIDKLQCVASNKSFLNNNIQVGLGETQCPQLWDYADNIDTIEFLKSLN